MWITRALASLKAKPNLAGFRRQKASYCLNGRGKESLFRISCRRLAFVADEAKVAQLQPQRDRLLGF